MRPRSVARPSVTGISVSHRYFGEHPTGLTVAHGHQGDADTDVRPFFVA